MGRAFLLWLCFAALARPDHRSGWPDPLFKTVPFDRWFEDGQQTRFKWTSRVFATGLNNHQRLGARVEVELDGVELVKRRGKGEMMLLIQFQDQRGRIFQSHRSLPLEDIKEEASHSLAQFLQDAFVLPGDYQVALAIFATETGEHATARRTLHVDPLSRDPLPNAWRDLPSVEILSAEEPPDTWWLHSIEGRLNLPVDNRRPVRLEVLVNLSATEQATGARFGRITGRNTAALLPVFKTLAQIQLNPGSTHVELLDLARRKISFEQILDSGANPTIDWPGLSNALSDANPHVIDVGSLEKRHQNAQFFVSEVKRRIAAEGPEPVCALIVLSSPMTFEKGEDLSPIAAHEKTQEKPGCAIFYIRYSAVMLRPVSGPQIAQMNPPPLGHTAGRSSPSGPFPPQGGVAMPDSLARTLKPLDPRVFDVMTAAECRKALATILAELARFAN
jgi:hypothetical protein